MKPTVVQAFKNIDAAKKFAKKLREKASTEGYKLKTEIIKTDKTMAAMTELTHQVVLINKERKKNAAVTMAELTGPILGYSWSNVDGDVVTFNPANGVIGFIETELKSLLQYDDLAIVHAGLIQKVKNKNEIDIFDYEDDKSAVLKFKGKDSDMYQPGEFVELGSDAIEEFNECPACFDVYLVLPGLRDGFGYNDLALGNEPALDAKINKLVKKIRAKLSK